MMNILHLTGSAYPWYTGGKEIFAFQLARELNILQTSNHILIHQTEKKEPLGEHLLEGVKTTVLPPVQYMDDRKFTYSMLVDEKPGFDIFLDTYQPDIVHFHDQFGGASLSHLHCIKKRGIKTILTYHSPGQSCPQHALLYHNRKICDGILREYRCTECQLNYFGVPEPFNYFAALNITQFIQQVNEGRIQKAFRQRELTKKFMEAFMEFYNSIDAVQVHAEWVRNILEKNGVAAKKIKYIELGGGNSGQNNKNPKFPDRTPLKMVFIGRCTYIKGVHVLIDAVKKLDDQLPVEVYFFGPYWEDTDYGRKMSGRIQNDKRFFKPELVPNDQLNPRLSEMDVCIIPSIWPETGPLTIFDAWSAGLPVIGSNERGIKELINKYKGGFVFQSGNPDQLSEIILSIIQKSPKILSGLTPPEFYPSFSSFAMGINLLYKKIYNE